MFEISSCITSPPNIKQSITQTTQKPKSDVLPYFLGNSEIFYFFLQKIDFQYIKK